MEKLTSNEISFFEEKAKNNKVALNLNNLLFHIIEMVWVAKNGHRIWFGRAQISSSLQIWKHGILVMLKYTLSKIDKIWYLSIAYFLPSPLCLCD